MDQLQIEDWEFGFIEVLKRTWHFFSKNFFSFLPLIVFYFLINLPTVFIPKKNYWIFIPSLILYFLIINNFIFILFALVVSEINIGGLFSYKRIIAKAIKILPRAISSNFLAALVVFGFFLLFIVPGIFAMVYLQFVTPAVALDHKKNKEALKYSSNLVDKKYWMIFYIFIFFSILQAVPRLIFSGLFKIGWMPPNLYLSLFLYFSTLFMFFLITSFNFVGTLIIYNRLKMIPDKFQAELLNETKIPLS